jgi:hypothetical protein
VSILGDSQSCIVPQSRGAAWMNPGAEIEVLPYALRELLAVENQDNPPGRAMPAHHAFSAGPAEGTLGVQVGGLGAAGTVSTTSDSWPAMLTRGCRPHVVAALHSQ